MSGKPACREDREDREDREERVQRRLALPVILAALVSVPAVFLAGLDGPLRVTGEVLNWVSVTVLTGESVILFLLAKDRIDWLRRNVWIVAVAVAAVPAVVLSVGPVQLLRLVRLFTALQVLRAGRILKAGQVLRRRAGLNGWWGRSVVAVTSLAAAAFVVIVLSDPESPSRQLITDLPVEVAIVLAAGGATILAVATVVVLRARRSPRTGGVEPLDGHTAGPER